MKQLIEVLPEELACLDTKLLYELNSFVKIVRNEIDELENNLKKALEIRFGDMLSLAIKNNNNCEIEIDGFSIVGNRHHIVLWDQKELIKTCINIEKLGYDYSDYIKLNPMSTEFSPVPDEVQQLLAAVKITISNNFCVDFK